MQEADHHARARRTLAIVGNLSARESEASGDSAPLDRAHLWLDASGVDGLLRQLKPALCLRAGGAIRALEFGSLDDFNPARLALPPSAREQLRAVLHDRTFQVLEATWRGIGLVADRVVEVANVALFDATPTELEHALEDDPIDNDLVHALRRATAERGEPFSVLVWLAEHVAHPSHLRRLRRISQLAAAEGFAVVTAAHPSLAALDATEPAQAGDAGRLWRELRCAPESEYLQLLMPRFLLRAPYDATTSADISGRGFQELPPQTDLATTHGRLLWGNPALLAAIVIARGNPAGDLAVRHLPAFAADPRNRTTLLCAESLLAEESAMHLMNSGVTPLICHAREDTLRLAALRSVTAWRAPLRIVAPIASFGGLAS